MDLILFILLFGLLVCGITSVFLISLGGCSCIVIYYIKRKRKSKRTRYIQFVDANAEAYKTSTNIYSESLSIKPQIQSHPSQSSPSSRLDQPSQSTRISRLNINEISRSSQSRQLIRSSRNEILGLIEDQLQNQTNRNIIQLNADQLQFSLQDESEQNQGESLNMVIELEKEELDENDSFEENSQQNIQELSEPTNRSLNLHKKERESKLNKKKKLNIRKYSEEKEPKNSFKKISASTFAHIESDSVVNDYIFPEVSSQKIENYIDSKKDAYIDLELFADEIEIPIHSGGDILIRNTNNRFRHQIMDEEVGNNSTIDDEDEITIDINNSSPLIGNHEYTYNTSPSYFPTLQLQQLPKQQTQNLSRSNINSSKHKEYTSLDSITTATPSPLDSLAFDNDGDQFEDYKNNIIEESNIILDLPLCLEFELFVNKLLDKSVKNDRKYPVTFETRLKSSRPQPHTPYVHCGYCYEEQAKRKNWNICFRCGFPLSFFVNFKDDERFCLVCSLMNKYDTSRKGRCTIHPVKDNYSEGSIFVAYKLKYSIGSYTKRKNTEASLKFDEMEQAWPLNQVIRYMFFTIIEKLVDSPYSQEILDYTINEVIQIRDNINNISENIEYYFDKFKIKLSQKNKNDLSNVDKNEFTIQLENLMNSLKQVLDNHKRLLIEIGPDELKKKSQDKAIYLSQNNRDSTSNTKRKKGKRALRANEGEPNPKRIRINSSSEGIFEDSNHSEVTAYQSQISNDHNNTFELDFQFDPQYNINNDQASQQLTNFQINHTFNSEILNPNYLFYSSHQQLFDAENILIDSNFQQNDNYHELLNSLDYNNTSSVESSEYQNNTKYHNSEYQSNGIHSGFENSELHQEIFTTHLENDLIFNDLKDHLNDENSDPTISMTNQVNLDHSENLDSLDHLDHLDNLDHSDNTLWFDRNHK